MACCLLPSPGGSPRFQLARNAAFFLEGKYTWVETESDEVIVLPENLAGADIPFDNEIDLSGLALTAGLLFTF